MCKIIFSKKARTRIIFAKQTFHTVFYLFNFTNVCLLILPLTMLSNLRPHTIIKADTTRTASKHSAEMPATEKTMVSSNNGWFIIK